jgi:putative endonuclease
LPPGKSRKEIGEEGERLAAEFLRKLGYKLLRRNWRVPGGEIDIIARDGEEVVFAEVKSRSSAEWGDPEEAVTPAKQRSLCLAARQFANRYRLRDRTLRFDVVAVLLGDDGRPKIKHYKGAFNPPSFMRRFR